ncbi:hypothetical protein ACFQL7_01765 [Halocatena marina]|uniref:Uncharacterized protein n=1 Tax=Halocatena marina TaxID=2934937 RepID=A0ABD5YLS2_9EURY
MINVEPIRESSILFVLVESTHYRFVLVDREICLERQLLAHLFDDGTEFPLDLPLIFCEGAPRLFLFLCNRVIFRYLQEDIPEFFCFFVHQDYEHRIRIYESVPGDFNDSSMYYLHPI